MSNLTHRCLNAVLMGLAVALISTSAFAQGSATSAISGVVVDSAGGVIPGATVSATNDATAGVSKAVTAANGTFTIPALNVGRYTLTVELQGFKKAVLKEVDVTSGVPATVRAVLEVGGITESIVVTGATEVVQTTSSAAATTMTTNQIARLPVASRNALDFVTGLPGVQTPGGNRDSQVNGLPQSSINITLDGVSVQDNHLKTGDGFFARMQPRLDSVEEVTVTTAGNGADTTQMGAIQINFTTRSGSNSFTGSGYYYYQHERLNTNTYFNKVRNLQKNAGLQRQPGVRVGGPVNLPGIYDGRGKAFFFVNYEENRTPRTITTTSNIMTTEAQSGIYKYLSTTGLREVNLYALAAGNGQTATPDPSVARLLNEILAATSGGTIEPLEGNYRARRFLFQQDTSGITRYPTARMDYNLSPAHRLTGSGSYNDLVSIPDTTNGQQRAFPGFPLTGDQISDRYIFQTTLRSTLSSNLVNEVKYGMSGGATLFSPGVNPEMWNGSVANQGGYGLGISAAGINNAGNQGTGISAREASTKFIEDRATWLRGAHSVGFGFTYTRADVWLWNQTKVPSITFSVPNGDPALPMFNTTNFPGSSSDQRNEARDLYAVLTGHISAVNGTARLDPSTNKYVYNGPSRQEGRLNEYDFYIQDNWRVRPNLSLNAGVRYVVQLPFFAKNVSYSTATVDDAWGISGNLPGCNPSDPTPATCNLFKTTTAGAIPTYQNLGKGVKGYQTDWNNVAPSLGVNWTPSAASGFLRSLLGEQGDTSFSAGWSRAFERHGMSDFTGVFSNNPGLTTNANRNVNNGNLGTLPLLLRDGNLGPPPLCVGVITAACMADAPVYPIPSTVTSSVNLFDPNLQVPYSDTWTTGMQRAIGRRSAIEVRYVGSRNRDQWTTYNYNETNILESGFLDEFKLAQANLYANIAAGRGQTFAYFGSGTGTSPLPIYLAHFSGVSRANSGDPARYTSGNFSSSNFVNPLSRFNPNPFTPAGTNSNTGLNGSATFRGNALAAGLPRNLFVANPDALGGANVTGHGGYTKANMLQTMYRRRLSGGLQFDTSYAFSKSYSSSRYSFRVDRKLTRQTGSEGDVTHAWKASFLYELPLGEGKRFFTGAGPIMDRVLGGWQVSGTMRVQSGRLVDLGNVRVIGMTEDEARAAFQLRRVGPNEIYMWPDDIVQNTIRAYSHNVLGYTQGTPTGRYFAPRNSDGCIETISNDYGDCGQRTFVITGPVFRTMDLSISKEVRLQGRKTVQFRVDALNVLDAVNFTPQAGLTNTNDNANLTQAGYQITGATSARVVQLVTRFNW